MQFRGHFVRQPLTIKMSYHVGKADKMSVPCTLGTDRMDLCDATFATRSAGHYCIKFIT